MFIHSTTFVGPGFYLGILEQTTWYGSACDLLILTYKLFVYCLDHIIWFVVTSLQSSNYTDNQRIRYDVVLITLSCYCNWVTNLQISNLVFNSNRCKCNKHMHTYTQRHTKAIAIFLSSLLTQKLYSYNACC